jgi:hypothetical protein
MTVGNATNAVNATNATTATTANALNTANAYTINGLVSTGDITTYRSGSPTTGVIYFGNGVGRYLYYDGTNYNLYGAGLNVGGFVSGTTGTFSGAVRINGYRLLQYDGQTTLWNEVNTNGVRIVNQAFNAQIWTCDNVGNTTAAGNVTAYSDERLKSDIQTFTNALDTVNSMRGVAFVKDGKAGIGVIAQEIQKVLPQVVQENNDGYLSVAYGNIVGVLIEAIKELKTEIDILKAK